MEVEALGQHISRSFNEDLERVRNSVLNMGGLVEEQFDRALKALTDADSELGLQVAEDDVKINQMEVSIDEECSRILATRAPAAGDLRLIIATIKTITDLERIGDEAEKIGALAARLAAVERQGGAAGETAFSSPGTMPCHAHAGYEQSPSSSPSRLPWISFLHMTFV